MRSDVAVLYVDPRGPYPSLVADWYDEARDARTYAGELPVIAHPPCAPWSKLRHFNRHHDPAHAVHAVAVVRALGGVLEHPAHSKLWAACALPRPGGLPDAWGGWTLEIDQCRWGHVGRKLTWLYIVGCSREDLPAIPGPRTPTHWCGGGRRQRGPGGGAPSDRPGRDQGGERRAAPENSGELCAVADHRCIEVQAMSHQQRRRTPRAFAVWLLEVAAKCRGGDA